MPRLLCEMSPQNFWVGLNPKLLEKLFPLPGAVSRAFGASLLTSQLQQADSDAEELPPLHGSQSSQKISVACSQRSRSGRDSSVLQQL